MKQLFKLLFLLAFGGAVYCMIEILYRGYTHWTMALVGGTAFVICGLVNEVLEWDTPFLLQMIVCTGIITLLELISGLILNTALHLNVWDYSDMWGNVLGQVCPLYTCFWFLISSIAITLDDFLRWKFFGEEKPRYKLL